MKKLSLLDKGFLLSESRETPMHVGGVSLYTLPEGASSQEFLQDLAENLRSAEEFVPPFGDLLQTGMLGVAGPCHWKPDQAMDVDYHIRHSALPQPGRYRELFTLISRLHGSLLDRNRPLWELHLIEGLQDRQFCIYTKMHHAGVDGARSVHISRSMMSTDPDYRLTESPLSINSWNKYRAKLKGAQASEAEIKNVLEALKSTFDSGAQMYSTASRIIRSWGDEGSALVPFQDVPRSSINTSVGGARRFVAQTWPFARISKVAKTFGGSFNDAVLAMCGGALRKYLELHGELPEKSLKAMVPVSLRQAGDVESSNAVAMISADLGTNVQDAARRFQVVNASTKAGKAMFQEMSAAETQLFSLLLQLPSAFLMPLGLLGRLPPFNTVVSNVPGIKETMYWNGARLDGTYPASIVMDGVAMNITLCTYGPNVDFGIIACRRSLPQVQRMIDYMEDALVDLEEAAGITGSPAKNAPPKKVPAKKRAARAKAKAAPQKA